MFRPDLARFCRRTIATTLALASVGGCFAAANIVGAQENPAAAPAQPARSGWTDEEIARLIGEYGSPSTFAALTIDFERLEPEAFANAVRSVVELKPEEDRQLSAGMAELKGNLDQAGMRQAVLLLDVHPQRMVAATALVRIDDRSDVLATTEMLKALDLDGLDEARFIDGVLVMRAEEKGDAARPKLADAESVRAALDAAGDAPIRAALFLSPDLRRVVGELAFALGDAQAIQGAKLAAKELQFATLVLNPNEEMSVDLTVRFATQEGAAQGAELAKAAIGRLRKDFPERETLPFSDQMLDRMAAWLTPELAGDSNDLVLHRSLNDEETLTLFRDTIAPSIVAARAQADRMKNSNNLKQIAIAMHNFHDTYRHLPLAGNQKKDGKAPGLSWRVHLLPFLEQAPLYNKFKLDEPWDSPHNKALIAEMPDVYKLDPSVPNGKTVALIPMGEGYAFSGEAPTTFADITDGTSNTLWVVEAAPGEAVTWTKPEDLDVDLSEIAGQLGPEGEATFLAMRGDGSIATIPDSADPKILHALFTRAGGEVIPEIRPMPTEKPQPPASKQGGAKLDPKSAIGKFRHVAIAFHNFHDTYRHLPLAGNQKKEGKPTGLSWRVHMLPFLEGGQPLYNQFRLDEPWDSEHNKQLIDQMPEVYKLDPKAPAGKTTMQLPLGEGFAFSGDEPTEFRDVTDGLSNTILVLQTSTSEAVTWTKPEDLQVDLSEFADQLGGEGEPTFVVALMDGRILTLDDAIDAKKLRAALTRAGGETVQLP